MKFQLIDTLWNKFKSLLINIPIPAWIRDIQSDWGSAGGRWGVPDLSPQHDQWWDGGTAEADSGDSWRQWGAGRSRWRWGRSRGRRLEGGVRGEGEEPGDQESAGPEHSGHSSPEASSGTLQVSMNRSTVFKRILTRFGVTFWKSINYVIQS